MAAPDGTPGGLENFREYSLENVPSLLCLKFVCVKRRLFYIDGNEFFLLWRFNVQTLGKPFAC